MQEGNKIEIFQSEDGHANMDVILQEETVWLTQKQMSELFGKAVSTINEHIKNIYKEKELVEEDTINKFGNSEFAKKQYRRKRYYDQTYC